MNVTWQSTAASGLSCDPRRFAAPRWLSLLEGIGPCQCHAPFLRFPATGIRHITATRPPHALRTGRRRQRRARHWLDHSRPLARRPLPTRAVGHGERGSSSSADELRPDAPGDPAPSEIDEILALQASRSYGNLNSVSHWGTHAAVVPWAKMGIAAAGDAKLSGIRDMRVQAILRAAMYDAVLAAYDTQAAYPRRAPALADSKITPNVTTATRSEFLVPFNSRNSGRCGIDGSGSPLPGCLGRIFRGYGPGSRRIADHGRREFPQ